MGLHAQINHFGGEVNIAIQGSIKNTEIAQIEAIFRHFQDQGCKTIRFDLSDTDYSETAIEATSPLSFILDRHACGSFTACD